jgi:hypothetical protein
VKHFTCSIDEQMDHKNTVRPHQSLPSKFASQI